MVGIAHYHCAIFGFVPSAEWEAKLRYIRRLSSLAGYNIWFMNRVSEEIGRFARLLCLLSYAVHLFYTIRINSYYSAYAKS